MDDPLLPDGSSHAYASFCKIKSNEDFMQGLNTTRWDIKPWHTNIFAGWPGGNINDSVLDIQAWMLAFDRLIVIDCDSDDDHYLCYLRNETTMDRDRWYGMMNIVHDDQLEDALRRDLDSPRLSAVKDPRMLRLTVNNLLTWSPDQLGYELDKLTGWPTCDHNLFRSVTNDMQSRQMVYTDRLHRLKNNVNNLMPATPAEHAIFNVYNERK
jgi:hypothetical protein